MDTKLTLKLDKQTIEKAKAYAAAHQKSLSRMVEAFLKSVIDKETKHFEDDIKISPFVSSMRTGVRLPPNLSYKEAYTDYLADKYK